MEQQVYKNKTWYKRLLKTITTGVVSTALLCGMTDITLAAEHTHNTISLSRDRDSFPEKLDGPPSNATNTSSSLSIAYPDWMSQLRNDVTISQLSIPGTHDSGAMHSAAAVDGPWVKAQSLELEDQLKVGIRYLDIRLGERKKLGNLGVYHGPVYQMLSWQGVLGRIHTFLSSHPGEVVFMRVKKEDSFPDKDFTDLLDKGLDVYSKLLWQPGSQNPTLGEVRGKLIIVQNFSPEKYHGIPYYSLRIQDKYDPSNKDEKWADILKNFKAANTDTSNLYLNHLSAQGSGPIKTIQYWAKPMNKKALAYMREPATKHTGIVAADFPGSALIEGIIALNGDLRN
ncbi:phosphatidylinositol-specific phospholipase C [Bacillus thuringiensis]